MACGPACCGTGDTSQHSITAEVTLLVSMCQRVTVVGSWSVSICSTVVCWSHKRYHLAMYVLRGQQCN